MVLKVRALIIICPQLIRNAAAHGNGAQIGGNTEGNIVAIRRVRAGIVVKNIVLGRPEPPQARRGRDLLARVGVGIAVILQKGKARVAHAVDPCLRRVSAVGGAYSLVRDAGFKLRYYLRKLGSAPLLGVLIKLRVAEHRRRRAARHVGRDGQRPRA